VELSLAKLWPTRNTACDKIFKRCEFAAWQFSVK